MATKTLSNIPSADIGNGVATILYDGDPAEFEDRANFQLVVLGGHSNNFVSFLETAFCDKFSEFRTQVRRSDLLHFFVTQNYIKVSFSLSVKDGVKNPAVFLHRIAQKTASTLKLAYDMQEQNSRICDRRGKKDGLYSVKLKK